MTDKFIELIHLLEKNKAFPYYAAERRADLFFAYFIEEMLSDFYKADVLFVAPEFPIKHANTNQANKADLLCVFKKTLQPIIVEIKTDRTSFKQSQLKDYIKNIPSWKNIVEGIFSITKNKNTSADYRVKYFNLLQRLEKLGLVRYASNNAPQLVDCINELKESESLAGKAKRSRRIIELVDELETGVWEKSVKLVYILPEGMIKLRGGCDILEFNKIKSDESKSACYQEFVRFLCKIKA